MQYKVAILQHRLLHCLVDFFNLLRELCLARNIDWHLVHGQAITTEKTKPDEGKLEWADKTCNHFVCIGGRDVLWQPLPDSVRDADMFVMMQENRTLSNYLLMLKSRFSGPMVAYWWHGVNSQSNEPSGFLERWKQLLVKQVDWWFAYTDLTVEIVCRTGFPAERITCLNNAIDTKVFSNTVESITYQELTGIRMELGLNDHSRVGIFCGLLYPDKHLELLIEAAAIIANKVRDFYQVVIGVGPTKEVIDQAAKKYLWVHPVGVKFGLEKAAYFKLAENMVNPGSLGSHTLDAFNVGLPVVSLVTARNGQEIAHLHNEVNGVLTRDSVNEYVAAVFHSVFLWYCCISAYKLRQESVARVMVMECRLLTVTMRAGRRSSSHACWR